MAVYSMSGFGVRRKACIGMYGKGFISKLGCA